jgi:hypothetical protein
LTTGRGGIPASVGLVPAILCRSPAALLVRVVVERLAAPVGVSGQAVLGADTILLSVLLANVLGGGNVDIGAGKRILAKRRLVNVEGETRVISTDVAGDADVVLVWNVQVDLGAIVNVDLGAAGVELRITIESVVQSEDLGTNEVVTRGKTSGQVDGKMAVVGAKGVDTPGFLFDVVAILPDLEPAGAGGRSLEHVVDLLDVDGTRTLVAFGNGAGGGVRRRLSELESDLGTAGSRADEVDGIGTIVV